MNSSMEQNIALLLGKRNSVAPRRRWPAAVSCNVMGKTKTPTAEVAAEAKLLRAIYSRVNVDLSQDQFGEVTGIGSAGMVWQYLHGHRPLNLDAACRFSRALSCRIDDFSPRIANAVRAALSLTASPTPDAAEGELTQEEAELLRAYRALQEKDRNSIRRQAMALALMAVEPAANERVEKAFHNNKTTALPRARRRKTT